MPAPEVATDRGFEFLEHKLAIYVHGTGSRRRNPALDVLVGRVPDARLAPLAASVAESAAARPWMPCPPPPVTPATEPTPPKAAAPSTVVLPLAAVRMAAVARSRKAASPWLASTEPSTRRLRLIEPPRESLWLRIRRRIANLFYSED